MSNTQEFSPCWLFDHEPITGEILSFLPPSDVFLSCRLISKTWKNMIESEHFSKLYYQRVLCDGAERVVFHFSLPDQLELITRKNFSFLASDSLKKTSFETIMISIYSMLEKIAHSNIKSMSWREHFYFKTLFCVGLNNSCQDEKGLDNLGFLKESLTSGQLEFMRKKFKSWGLSNMLKRDLIVGMFNYPRCFIMFRDDGKPFFFSSEYLDAFSVLSYHSKSLFDDFDDFKPGVKVEAIQQFIEYGSEQSRDKVKLSERDSQMWEDYLTCVNPDMRQRRIQNIHPFERVVQTPYMSDYQHVELSEKAQKTYYNEVFLKWRPTITWNE